MNRVRTSFTLAAAALALAALPTAGTAQASGNVQVTARLLDVRSQVAALQTLGSWLRRDSAPPAGAYRPGAGPLIVWRAASGQPGRVLSGRPRGDGDAVVSLRDTSVVIELLFVDN